MRAVSPTVAGCLASALLLLAAGCSGERQAPADGVRVAAREGAASEATPVDRLFEAARGGRVEEVSELLASGVEVDARNRSGMTPLMAAAIRRKTEVVRLLLESGAVADAVEARGWTTAVLVFDRPDKRGSAEILNLLLDHGAEMTRDKGAESFLAKAVHERQWRLAERLLERGLPAVGFANRERLGEAVRSEDRKLLKAILDPSRRDGRASALCIAIQRDDTELLEELLGQGLEDRRCERSSLPLVEAADRGRLTALEALLAQGAEVDRMAKNGITALMAAARENQLAAARLLVENGATVNLLGRPADSAPLRPTESGPLIEAVRAGHDEMVDLLLASGADPNLADSFGSSALGAATARSRDEMVRRLTAAGEGFADMSGERLQGLLVDTACNADMLEQLLAGGADPAAPDDEGTPAIVAVAGCGHGLESIGMLLAAGVDIDSRDAAGRTPLIAAAARGEALIAEDLVGRGASLELVDDRGWTALTTAVADRRATVVAQALVDLGADVEHRDAEGATPLMRAAEARNWDAVELLLEAGALRDGSDASGRTAAAYFRGAATPRAVERRIETVDGTIRYTDSWFQGCSGKKRVRSDRLLASCYRDSHDVTGMKIYQTTGGVAPAELLRGVHEQAELFDLPFLDGGDSRLAARAPVPLYSGAVAVSSLAKVGGQTYRLEVHGDEERVIHAEWILAIMVENFERENQ